MRTLIFWLGLGLGYSGSLQAKTPQFRAELQKAAPSLCGETKESLADFALYDTQVELAFVANVSDLADFALKFATTNRHRGYSYGSCKDKRQWIVSTPAPGNILALDAARRSIAISYQNLKRNCATFDVDAIENGKHQPLSIIREEAPGPLFDRIELTSASYETVTLTCHPADKTKEGPELWALLALQPAEKISGLKNEADLLNWIQDQRIKSGLSRLAPGDKELQALADESALTKDLHHPRALLLRKKSQLKRQRMELLGENRASATSFSGIAELLWNSPSHRRLLLNPKATMIALNTSQRGDEKLLVMVLAKQ